MKPFLFSLSLLLFFLRVAGAEEIPAEAQRLLEKKARASAQSEAKLIRDLEALRNKYTRAGNTVAAKQVEILIAARSAVPGSSRRPDPEFDGTKWAFHNKAGLLGELEFLPGGRIRSKEYKNSTWTRIDKDTIRFEFEKDESKNIAGGHVVFSFQDSTRTKMSGLQSVLGTPRYLLKAESKR